MTGRLREAMRHGRARGAGWVRLVDGVRGLASSEGRARLWTRIAHRGTLHQVSGHTEPDRYPELFDLAAKLQPEAARILSFGCSTGEEIEAIRRRFPAAEIVGAEINPKSRSAARRRMRNDARAQVVGPHAIQGEFDLIFALAVLQVQPHRVVDAGIDNLSAIYPFERFDRQVSGLAGRLRPGGNAVPVQCAVPRRRQQRRRYAGGGRGVAAGRRPGLCAGRQALPAGDDRPVAVPQGPLNHWMSVAIVSEKRRGALGMKKPLPPTPQPNLSKILSTAARARIGLPASAVR